MKKSKKKQILDKKLREYRNVLKKDEDWDWHFILQLLRYKLERTRRCILSNNIVVEAPKIARQIREVAVLLERVEKDRYYDEISIDFRKKYGRIRMITGKAQKGAKSVPVEFKYQRETPKNSAVIRKESRRLWKQAERMQHYDLKKAFDLMQKNIWGWWD